MALSVEVLLRSLEPVLGLACCRAFLSYYRNIVVDFGADPGTDATGGLRSEWTIRSWCDDWRLCDSSGILVGSNSEEPDIGCGLARLVGQRLERIVYQPPNEDVRLFLEGGYVVEILQLSGKNSVWGARGPSGWLDIRNPWGEMVEEEKALDEHSEKCAARWKGIVPPYTHVGQCGSCFYYRRLRGQFYFWDYGLCSNPASEYDGRVVQICSGCKAYSAKLHNGVA